jgi:hypothetical protein
MFSIATGCAIAAALVAGARPCVAMEPPTTRQIEQYREDGTLKARIAEARRIGNHRLVPGHRHLNEKLLGLPPVA